MKITPKNVLREMARQLGVKVKFVNYLQDDIHGKFLPREKRILINANKPRDEHVFTLLHEIAHYLLHFKRRANRRHCPWYLRLHWKTEAIAVFFSKFRRAVRFAFTCEKGREWEADVWAMCGLVYLKKFAGFSDLPAFLARHPEKKQIYWLASVVVVYTEAKRRVAGAVKAWRKVRQDFSTQLSRSSKPSLKRA